MTQLTYTETLTVTSCWCGIHLAVPDNLLAHARDKKGTAIFCPLGHEFVFGTTNADKLREKEKELERERQRVKATRDLLAAEENSHRATKGHLTRVKKRVQNGVCPRCNRTFVNLQRHMASKHGEECEG